MNKLSILGLMISSFSNNNGLAVLNGTISGTEKVENHEGKIISAPFFMPFQMLGERALKFQRAVPGDGPQNVAVLAQGQLDFSSWESGGEKHSRLRAKILSVELVNGQSAIKQSDDTLRLEGGYSTSELRGHLTGDPEVMETKGGLRVNFQLAVNENWKQGGQQKEKAHFIPVVVWREEAERFMAAQPKKGEHVYLKGRATSENWVTDSGQKHAKVKVTASCINVIPRNQVVHAPTAGRVTVVERPALVIPTVPIIPESLYLAPVASIPSPLSA